jgi:DNA-binding CsgD family transcriptional regulator
LLLADVESSTMPWATKTSIWHGPRVWPCPPEKRSRTHSAGRGQRKRPASGWSSLTPTELDVVRLVSEGLTNNDIATRLFVSPRTVQTHLTHVYTKLGLTSRVQLVQEAARHN